MESIYFKKQKFPPMYTKIFRDPEVWEEIRNIIKTDFDNKGDSLVGGRLNIFRSWSAGCATGEEAYSLASILSELFDGKKIHWNVYGTDIRDAVDNEQKKKLACFFNMALDAKIRFRCHDLISDAPLPHTNLILCRNVLMFLKREYQEIVCDKLYDSLRTGGYLILGNAESLRGKNDDKFRVINRRLKIFQKI